MHFLIRKYRVEKPLDDNLHILIADDDHDVLAALKMLLTCEGYQVTLASQPEQVIRLFKSQSFDCAMLDLNFNMDTTSGEEGLALIAKLTEIDDSIPLIGMTGWATVELAVNAMQRGARDFIQKPWENERVLTILSTQIKLAKELHQSAKLNRENQLLKAEHSHLQGLVAESESMKSVMAMVKQVAVSDINVLITGENGTGKSLFAEKIHALSQRSEHSLIKVNMGAIAENLFESEMFGHIKGAFTDARENRIGRFELADGGSLFLDEIGNIPMSQQSKLLRVLESQEFEKVGSSKTQQVDVRIISATNANIEHMITDGLFRQDLLYRLNTIEIELPPLRERAADIVPMANQFLTKFANKYQKSDIVLSALAQSALMNYQWPGNVRELSHMMERAVVLTPSDQIDVTHLGIVAQNNSSQQIAETVTSAENMELSLDEIEKEVIRKRIQYHSGNMNCVAKSLGLSRSAFYRRIDKYQL